MCQDWPPDEVEHLLMLLAEHNPDVVWMFSPDLNELKVVEGAYEEIWGRSIRTLADNPSDLLNGIHPDDREKAQENIRQLSNEQAIEVEYRVNAEENYQRHVWVAGEPIYNDENEFVGVAGFAREITDWEQPQQDLAQPAKRLEAFSTAFPDLAFIFDENGRYRDVLAGDKHQDLLYNDLIDDVRSLRESCLHDVFPDEQADQFLSSIRSVLTTGEEQVIEYALDVPAGERWFEARIVPLPDDLDGQQAVVWVSRDVTERKQREREIQRQNERLEEFASIVSHDLRNPLNVADGRLALAREERDSKHLDAIAGAHDRIYALIEDLMTLAREGKSVMAVEPVSLAATANGCWRNVETADATLRTKTDQTIQADGGRLQQLLENLIRNAVEHGGPAVTVTVGDLNDGFYVADDGPGIPPGEREHVFETGYSTADEGTGFGLSIVQEIVDAHEWEIAITESADGGAQFEITGVGAGL